MGLLWSIGASFEKPIHAFQYFYLSNLTPCWEGTFVMLNVFLIYSKDLPDIKVGGQTLKRALEIVLMVFLLLVFIHAYSSLHGLG